MPDAKTPTAAPNPAEKKLTPASKIPGRPKNVTPDAKINKKSAPLPELIIVADDFGVSEQRNLGILHAMEAGVVTLASVMVNGAAAEAGIQLARERGFLGRLGLHLNLTEGRPILGAAEVPSLLLDGSDADQEGTGLGGPEPRFRGKFGFREACDAGAVVAAEAAAEARAQLAWFEEHVGRPAARVDGHQHCHVHAAVSAALAGALAAAGVTHTRIPAERCGPGVLCALCGKVRAEAEAAAAVYAAAGVRFADGFVGLSLCGGGYSARQLADAVRAQLKGGALSCEVMVHPGYRARSGGGAWDGFDADARREGELRTLCDPELRAALDGVARLAPPPEAARYEAGGGAEEAVRLRCGDVELRLLAPPPVHLDPLNLPLLEALPDALVEGDRVLYHGCGSGLIGLLALRHGAAHVRFADVDEGAVRAAAANAAAAGYERGRQWCASRGDLDDKPPKSVRFADLVQFADVDVVLCNPPQMPGPEALAAARPDKYGGADGAHFYRRLAAHGAALLGDGGRVVFLQTSFSSFAAVDALFGAAGFGVRTLKTQKRSASLAAIDALAPGCADWLLDLHARGGAHWEEGVEGDDGARTLVYEQRLAVATRE